MERKITPFDILHSAIYCCESFIIQVLRPNHGGEICEVQWYTTPHRLTVQANFLNFSIFSSVLVNLQFLESWEWHWREFLSLVSCNGFNFQFSSPVYRMHATAVYAIWRCLFLMTLFCPDLSQRTYCSSSKMELPISSCYHPLLQFQLPSGPCSCPEAKITIFSLESPPPQCKIQLKRQFIQSVKTLKTSLAIKVLHCLLGVYKYIIEVEENRRQWKKLSVIRFRKLLVMDAVSFELW